MKSPFQRAAVANPQPAPTAVGAGMLPTDPARLTEALSAGKLGEGTVPANATEAGVAAEGSRSAVSDSSGPAMPTKAQSTGNGLVLTPDTVTSSDAAHALSSGAAKPGARQ